MAEAHAIASLGHEVCAFCDLMSLVFLFFYSVKSYADPYCSFHAVSIFPSTTMDCISVPMLPFLLRGKLYDNSATGLATFAKASPTSSGQLGLSLSG